MVFLALWEPTPVGDGFLALWEPTPVGDGFLALWEPRPRGDGCLSARLYRDEGVAPTNITPADDGFFPLWETTPVGDGLLFCGNPALGAMSSGLRGFIATRASLLQKFNGDLTPINRNLIGI